MNQIKHETLKVAVDQKLHSGSLGLGLITGGSKLNSLAGIRAPSLNQIHSHQSINSLHLSHYKSITTAPVDLSENDQFHQQLNSLQKLMFARPCNYSAFLQHSEIQQLVNFQERLIFENRVSSELVKTLRKEKKLAVNPSFSVEQLFLNGRYMPIFRKEQLSEYRLFRGVSLASQVCEYRSRICFQFRKIHLTEGSSESENPLDQPGSKIHYQYWWSNQILILCSIEAIQICTASLKCL